MCDLSWCIKMCFVFLWVIMPSVERAGLRAPLGPCIALHSCGEQIEKLVWGIVATAKCSTPRFPEEHSASMWVGVSPDSSLFHRRVVSYSFFAAPSSSERETVPSRVAMWASTLDSLVLLWLVQICQHRRTLNRSECLALSAFVRLYLGSFDLSAFTGDVVPEHHVPPCFSFGSDWLCRSGLGPIRL